MSNKKNNGNRGRTMSKDQFDQLDELRSRYEAAEKTAKKSWRKLDNAQCKIRRTLGLSPPPLMWLGISFRKWAIILAGMILFMVAMFILGLIFKVAVLMIFTFIGTIILGMSGSMWLCDRHDNASYHRRHSEKNE